VKEEWFPTWVAIMIAVVATCLVIFATSHKEAAIVDDDYRTTRNDDSVPVDSGTLRNPGDNRSQGDQGGTDARNKDDPRGVDSRGGHGQ
jgi:hypothetical protein